MENWGIELYKNVELIIYINRRERNNLQLHIRYKDFRASQNTALSYIY